MVVRGLQVVGLLLTMALLGCQQQAAQPEAEAPEPAQTAAEQPAEAAPEPPAEETGKSTFGHLEGVLVSIGNDASILLPDGWSQVEQPAQARLQMVREQPLANTKITVSVDSWQADLPPRMALGDVRQQMLRRLTSQLQGRGFTLVSDTAVNVDSYPGLAVTADLEDKGNLFRTKQVIVLVDQTFWLINVLGPRAEFAAAVEPEFNDLLSSLRFGADAAALAAPPAPAEAATAEEELVSEDEVVEDEEPVEDAPAGEGVVEEAAPAGETAQTATH